MLTLTPREVRVPGDQEAQLSKAEQSRKRRKWQRVVVILLTTLFAGVLLIGITGIVALAQQLSDLERLLQVSLNAGSTGSVDPWWKLNPSHPINPDTNQLSAFLTDCEKNVNGWKAGQVDYPKSLSLDKNQTGAYSIAVDIRDTPSPAERMISDTNPQSAPIAVKCNLSARLTSIDRFLVVDNAGWVHRTFTPAGYVNFSWATMALASGSHTLRLELRATVTTQISPDGIATLLAAAGDSSPDVITFISRVDVHGSMIEEFNQKFNDYWPIILTLAATIGGALLALIRWLRMLGRALHSFSADRRGKQRKSDRVSNLNGPNDRAGASQRSTEDHTVKTE